MFAIHFTYIKGNHEIENRIQEANNRKVTMLFLRKKGGCMTKKRVAQGIDNFKKIIDVNAYYVDKTLLIRDITDINDQIILITRPRRFGKTLNMSMLKYFFEKKRVQKV
jgi:hypothetical protein